MKARTILCALAATMMLFAACGKDDESNDTPAIVGTWEYHETQENIVREYTETMAFKADGTMSLWFTCYDTYPEGGTWHYGISLTGPYTIDGNTLRLSLRHNGVMNCEDSDFTYNEPDADEPAREYEFTYEISGNILKVDKGGEQVFGHGGDSGVMEYVKK